MSNISEFDALKAVGDALEAVEADAQGRILAYLNLKYGSGTPIPVQSAVVAPAQVSTATPSPSIQKKAKKARKSSAAPKILKDLNLKPQGKKSIQDFVAEKQPVNLLEKCTALVYYFSHILEVEKVSTDHVFTAFKTLEWRIPNDLQNTLQQAGSKGWLDTAVANDLKTTSMGENLVEHDLPKTTKKK